MITTYLYVLINAIRTPFQGGFLVRAAPRAEALGCSLSALRAIGAGPRKCPNSILLKIANEEGARISLGTDAHHPWQFAFIELSLAAAILARMPPERIINFMTLPQLTKLIGR